MSTLRALGSNIICQIVKKDTVSPGGIVLTAGNSAEVSKAKVLHIGSKVEDVSVGEIIIPNWKSAVPTEYDGEVIYVVKEEDVVMVITE